MESERSDKLARRIRVLDRLHRPIAILLAMLAGGSVVGRFDNSETILADYGVALAVALGALTWLIVSLILVGMLAIFETRLHRIVCSDQLPQATLLSRK